MVVLLGLGYIWLPDRDNPLAPLSIQEAPGFIARIKLRALEDKPQACLALLAQAQRLGYLQYRPEPDTDGPCPLHHIVRISGFGSVQLSSSFLASCPLALRSAMFIHQQAIPLTRQMMASPLAQIDHLGSFACRNIYHRAHGPLSDHASASALDVSGLRLVNGQRISVLKGWKQNDRQSTLLNALFHQSCRYYGSAIGPDYNAAHANHFHLSSRGWGFCH